MNQLGQLADELLETLGRFRRQSRRTAPKPEHLAGLSQAQVELIRLVRQQPGLSVAAAATELGLAANTISTLVGRLVESGHLDRTPDPRDRRVARLSLTPDAATEVAAWRDRRSTAIVAALAALPPDDRELLTAALPILDKVTVRLPDASVLAAEEAVSV
jgi:DNA-binding MarR family transcriptional regulator